MLGILFFTLLSKEFLSKDQARRPECREHKSCDADKRQLGSRPVASWSLKIVLLYDRITLNTVGM